MTFLQLGTAAGMTGVVAKATLLLLIGWCGALILRRAPAGARHLVWLTVIMGVLILPALARMAPVRVAILPSVNAAQVVTAPDAGSAITAFLSQGLRSAESSGISLFSMPGFGTLAIDIWLGMAGVLIGWLIAGMLSVRRIQRGAHVLDSAEWTRALSQAANQLDLAAVPRLIVSDRVDMAFACNALAPTIVLPSTAEEWSDDRRHAVLLHELGHVQRRDLVGHLIARIACAVYWFHPLVWVAARRLRAESEQACDDLVLTAGIRASDYAQDLLDLVTSLGHRQGAPAATLPLVRRNEFEGRLLAILDRAKRRKALGRLHAGILVGVLAISTMSIGAVIPVPRAEARSISASLPQARATTGEVPRPTPASPSNAQQTKKKAQSTTHPTKARSTVTHGLVRPRFDSLIPYVPGPPMAGRGGGPGFIVKKVPVTPPDSGR